MRTKLYMLSIHIIIIHLKSLAGNRQHFSEFRRLFTPRHETEKIIHSHSIGMYNSIYIYVKL